MNLELDNVDCEKCSGHNVVRYEKRNQALPTRETMNEFANRETQPQMSYLVAIFRTYVLKCQSCGYEVAYSKQ
jgi:hypothetical protein